MAPTELFRHRSLDVRRWQPQTSLPTLFTLAEYEQTSHTDLESLSLSLQIDTGLWQYVSYSLVSRRYTMLLGWYPSSDYEGTPRIF